MKTYPMKARIRNAGAGAARVDIFDDVGSDGWGGGISAQDFAAQMAGVRGPLDVHINSYGGDVFAGQTMAEAIRDYPGPVTTKVDGIAASIASVIFQAGARRVMAPGALMFVHDAWSMAAGNAEDMRAEAETLDKVSNVLAAEYARRAGGTPEQWRGVMQKTAWYDAQEALAAGLADEVSGGAAQRPPSVDVESMAASAPGRIMAALRSMPRAAGMSERVPSEGGDMAAGGQECKTCAGNGRLKHPGTGKNGMKCPGCDGTGRYDPDHDGDDDSTAEGDTDHDYVEPDGSPGPKASARPLAAAAPYKPEPYHRDPDETVECPVCHLFNDTDAKFCDQCGAKLEGRDDVRVLPAPAGDAARGALAAMTFAELRDAMAEAIRPLVGGMLREEVAAAAARLPVLDAAKVDDSPWDAAKAWHNGAQAKDPAAFYKAICAGEKTSGDPGTQAHWALPYRYTPDSAPNAAGVRAAWAVLNGAMGGVDDLADKDAAEAKVKSLMKQVSPDWKPDDSAKSVFSQRLEQMRGAMPPLKGDVA